MSISEYKSVLTDTEDNKYQVFKRYTVIFKTELIIRRNRNVGVKS